MTPNLRRLRFVGLAFVVLAGVIASLSVPLGSVRAEALPPQIVVSTSASRAAPVPLEGTTAPGTAYVFVSPESGISAVSFWLDNPEASGSPRQVEKNAPWDFAGGTVSAANSFDTTTLATGQHSITAVLTLSSGQQSRMTANFTVDNGAASLRFTPSGLTLYGTSGGPVVGGQATLVTSDRQNFSALLTSSEGWLSGQAPASTAGSTTVAVSANPSQLAAGTHTAQLTATAPGYTSVTLTVELVVAPSGGYAYTVVYSTSRQRTAPQPLEGATLTGIVYPYVSPSTDVVEVKFYLDDPEASGVPLRIDGKAPFDLGGSNADGTPKPWDSASIPDGQHQLLIVVKRSSGTTQTSTSTFTASNGTNSTTLTPSTMSVQMAENAPPTQRDVVVDAVQPGTTVALVSNAGWLSVAGPTTVTAPANVSLTIDPSGLSAGSHRATLTASAAGAFSSSTTVTLTLGEPGPCSPLACSLAKVPTPYTLNFLYDSSKILDDQGVGTGFTWILPSATGSAYERQNVHVDTSSGTFTVKTGSASFEDLGQKNAIGVGFDGPRMATTLSTTLVNVPTGSGKYEQAGLWFGYDQQNINKLVVISTPQGQRIEFSQRVGGVVTLKKSAVATVGSNALTLDLLTDPVQRKVTAYYTIGIGTRFKLGTFSVPGEFFSFDGAGIDPVIGTRSFAGVFASHRQASASTAYTFSQFSITAEAPGQDGGDFAFGRVSYSTQFPTAMAFGPDGKLYTTNLFGAVHRLTIGSGHQVVQDDTVGVLGKRLALGIAIDPASTPSNVIVWVAHSSPVTAEGLVDSGTVSRLSGPDLTVRQDVITGLPRSIANHGTSSIGFGPDGRLYIAQGGNTGAGAPNQAGTEFGDRGEQALSAALLVADVKAAGFDGTCSNTSNMYGPAPCDVEVFASGLRNAYSFAFHRNGHIYAPDNGLGVVGSYPPSPAPPCTGFGDTRSWQSGGNNPGSQNDSLYLLEQGLYYGHPNPARDECVFKDGRYQNVPPMATYRAPVFDLGADTSTNGIFEYVGDAFCGDLDGRLLVSNYSVGDDIISLELAADGRSITSATPIVGNLRDPLPMIQGPDGAIWVGEFGGNAITALVPEDRGCWRNGAALPVELLDASGAAIGSDLYVVGGKTATGHKTQVWVNDTTTGAWRSAPSLPGLGVENPSVVSHAGKLYVFGGSTEPFAGALAKSYVFDPGTSTWTSLPDMPRPRAGAPAVVQDDRILVIGGMASNGESLASVDAYSLTSGTWSSAPALEQPRDNASAVTIAGTVYVAGGRHRLADGSTASQVLASMELLDAGASAWTPGTAMPTARRTAAAGVVSGRMVVAGGEGRADGLAFDAVEEFDPVTNQWAPLRRMPTGRHGAASAVVSGDLHVVGGGPVGGFSLSNGHEIFTPSG